MLIEPTRCDAEEAFGAQAFDDVARCDGDPPCSAACEHVQVMARRGYASGCSAYPKLFCPRDPMTRAHAAAFLSRSLFTVDEPF